MKDLFLPPRKDEILFAAHVIYMPNPFSSPIHSAQHAHYSWNSRTEKPD